MRKVASCCAFVAVSVLATSAAAQSSATLRLVNNTNTTIEFWVDGVHRCQPGPHTQPCTSQETIGRHRLHADRGDTHDIVDEDKDIPASGLTWEPFPGEQQQQ